MAIDNVSTITNPMAGHVVLTLRVNTEHMHSYRSYKHQRESLGLTVPVHCVWCRRELMPFSVISNAVNDGGRSYAVCDKCINAAINRGDAS